MSLYDEIIASGFTQAHADAIKALAEQPDVITPARVARVLEGAE